MEQAISIKEVLVLMQQGRPFTLTYVTADTRRGTGGELKTVTGAVLSGYNVPDGTRLTAAIMQNTEPGKKPNHSKHFTRNLLLKDGFIRKVHVDLITSFNGQKVL